MLKKLLSKPRKVLGYLIEKIQKILVAIALFFIYIFCIGITLGIIVIFNRGLLKIERAEKGTFWEDAKGYNPDYEKCQRQA